MGKLEKVGIGIAINMSKTKQIISKIKIK